VTVRQFYEEKVVNQLKSTGDVELEAAFLGKSKESLDIIDLSLSLDSAVPLFGPFLHYRTHSINQGSPPTRDALAILMSSQRQMSTSGPHRSDTNKMDLTNISMVVAPNLFVALPARHNLDDVTMAAKTSHVVRLLIKYHRLLWTVRGK